jgi:hypothetical protein
MSDRADWNIRRKRIPDEIDECMPHAEPVWRIAAWNRECREHRCTRSMHGHIARSVDSPTPSRIEAAGKRRHNHHSRAGVFELRRHRGKLIVIEALVNQDSDAKLGRGHSEDSTTCYDEEMRTLLISGGETAAPSPLVDLLTRGSTSFEQRRAADLARAGSLVDADRVVFWSASDDPTIAEIAERYRTEERAERREGIVFITASQSSPPPTLPSSERYVWPQDRDRLVMAFLTGA